VANSHEAEDLSPQGRGGIAQQSGEAIMSYARELIEKRRKAYREWERYAKELPKSCQDRKKREELAERVHSLDRRIDGHMLIGGFGE